MRTAPLANDDMLEREWQRMVVELAKMLGWFVYHTYDSRRSTHGFPDLVLVRDRVLFVELKRESGRLTVEQDQWASRLRTADAEHYLWRPSDLEQVGVTLAARARPVRSTDPSRDVSGAPAKPVL